MSENPARKLTVQDLDRFLGLDVPAAGELTGFLDAAAVLAAFDPIQLRPFGDVGPRDVVVDRLLPRCEPVTHGPVRGLWALSLPDRVAALQRLGTRDRMRQALRANPDRPEIPLQKMLERVIDGAPVDLGAAPREDLAALVTVRGWLEGILDRLPGEAEIGRAIDRLDLRAPLLRLAGGTFIGRTAELAQIREYALGAPGRPGARPRAPKPTAPLFVYGPGGVGKSTLLARFLLDLPGDDTVRTAYVNIDRPTIRPERPVTLLIDVISQLRPQLPGAARALEALATELAYSGSREDAGRRSESAPEGGAAGAPQIERFAAVLRPLLSGSVLVMVLDTFEEAQFLGYDVVWPLTRFLLRLTEALPSLRLVVCGRVLPPEFVSLAFPRLPRESKAGELDEANLLAQIPLPARPVNLAVLAAGEARELLRRLVAESGQPALPGGTLDDVIGVVSSNPMCLRLAARLVAEEGTKQLLAFPAEFLTRLRAEKIQALLYGRILGHLHAEDARSVAYPGLVVRRITPGVIREVLAGPCDLNLAEGRDEHDIFRALQDEAALVQVDPEDGSLRHRADVRRAMLEDLTDQVPAELAAEIDRAAVRYYQERPDPVSRAEEIYHRLRLREPTTELDARWMPNAAPWLKSAGEELPARERLWLAGKLGVTIDESVRRTADQDAWEDQAARSADRYLGSSAPDQALQVLHERRARLPRSRLYLLEAEAYRLAGQPDQALEVARAGVTAVSKAGAIDMALELLLQMVVIEESRGGLAAAAGLLGEVKQVAGRGTSAVLRLRARVTELRIRRKRRPDGYPEEDELRSQALDSLTDELLTAVGEQPVLLRETAAELGDNPRVVSLAVEALGLEISSNQQAEALAEAVKALDAADMPPGRLSSAFAAGAARFREFETSGFDVASVRSWATVLLTERDVRALATALGAMEPGDEVLRAFRDYFRGGVDESIARSNRNVGRWSALAIACLGALAASFSSSGLLVALPAVFRGIRLDPLPPGNVSYLLWATALFPVALTFPLVKVSNRIGQIRTHNLGFAVFTLATLALALNPLSGPGGALWLIGWRTVEAVGISMLMANTGAILSEAFPSSRRGRAFGTYSLVATGGVLAGLIAGGALASLDWRLVFYLLVPFGLLGTVWSRLTLRETGTTSRDVVDWPGVTSLTLGLLGLLAAVIFAVLPYGGHAMGWTSPWTLACLAGGLALLALCLLVERRVPDPVFNLSLLRILPFSVDTVTGLLISLATGGLQFALVIWLQGIWLPAHGYAVNDTPFWCAVYLVPVFVGLGLGSLLSGFFSVRDQAIRWLVPSGLLVWVAAFGALVSLPAGNFAYAAFGPLVFVLGVANGMLGPLVQSRIYRAVPPGRITDAIRMTVILQGSGQMLSEVVYFFLLAAGVSTRLPAALVTGLTAQGVPVAAAQQAAPYPPASALFAAYLGHNPVSELLTPAGVLTRLPVRNVTVLTSNRFFPQVIAAPFGHGLFLSFTFAAALLAVGLSAQALYRRGPLDTFALDEETDNPGLTAGKRRGPRPPQG